MIDDLRDEVKALNEWMESAKEQSEPETKMKAKGPVEASEVRVQIEKAVRDAVLETRKEALASMKSRHVNCVGEAKLHVARFARRAEEARKDNEQALAAAAEAARAAQRVAVAAAVKEALELERTPLLLPDDIKDNSDNNVDEMKVGGDDVSNEDDSLEI